jgi:hypothetical protein
MYRWQETVGTNNQWDLGTIFQEGIEGFIDNGVPHGPTKLLNLNKPANIFAAASTTSRGNDIRTTIA